MAMKTLEDAFVEELKDLLSAEKQLLKALPKMAKSAGNAQLKRAFEEHQKQTDEHVQRLEQTFELLGRPARASKCEAMEGLIEEGKELMELDGDPDTLDALLIAAAQKVEHYEIASYGTACAWAQRLGYDEALGLLRQTLDEEKQTDEKLTGIAESVVNPRAASEEK